jgi:hypothetical protein
MFVGEGPGHDEDVRGEPFVGRAGQLPDRDHHQGMKLRREDVYIANVVKCRPPNNRNPETDEIASCMPFLQRQIELVAPRSIVALGTFAAQTLLGVKTPITPHARGLARLPRHQGHADVPSGVLVADAGRQAAGVGGHQARHGGAGVADLMARRAGWRLLLRAGAARGDARCDAAASPSPARAPAGRCCNSPSTARSTPPPSPTFATACARRRRAAPRQLLIQLDTPGGLLESTG